MTVTKLTNLIDPQVIGAYLDKKMGKKIKFMPLAKVDYDLQGVPGSTLTVPVWKYIGDAEDLAEGVEGTTSLLESSTANVKVKKAVKNIELTDEAILSGHGNPVGEANDQLLKAITQKVDADCVTALKQANDIFSDALKTANVVKNEITGFADALLQFGEDIDEQTYCLIPPSMYAEFRKDPMFMYVQNGEKVISGHVGMFMGMNIVVTERLTDAEAFLLREGGLGLVLKRNTQVETERNVKSKTNLISADMHYAVYARNAEKIVKITLTEPQRPASVAKASAKK